MSFDGLYPDDVSISYSEGRHVESTHRGGFFSELDSIMNKDFDNEVLANSFFVADDLPDCIRCEKPKHLHFSDENRKRLLSNDHLDSYGYKESYFEYESANELNINSLSSTEQEFSDSLEAGDSTFNLSQEFTLPDEVISPIIMPAENWVPLAQAPPRMQWLGRALGTKDESGGSNDERPCSFWLAGGGVMVGAAHCRSLQEPGLGIGEDGDLYTLNRNVQCPDPKSLSTRIESKKSHRIKFGMYPNFKGEKGLEDALNRVIDLGVPRSQALAPSKNSFFSEDRLQTVTCQLMDSSYRQTDGCRDVDFYTCQKGLFAYEQNRRIERFRLFPGAVFGSIPMTLTPPFSPQIKKGDTYSVISINHIIKDKQGAVQTLFSPNGTIDVVDSNGLFFQGVGAFTKRGSSGAPAISTKTFRAIGTLSGTWWRPWPWPDRDEFSTIPNRRIRFIPPWPFSTPVGRNTLSLSRITKNSPRIGSGTSNILKSLSCPFGFAAAGVLASTLFSKPSEKKAPQSLGNLGLICLPFSKEYQFENAIVVAGGSVDTKKGQVLGRPFDSYMLDHFSTGSVKAIIRREEILQPQSFQMCPPNTFLQSVQVVTGLDSASGSTFIKSLSEIECNRYDFPEFGKTSRTPRIPMGDSKASPQVWSRCPSDTFVSGIDIWSKERTHGFELQCSNRTQVGNWYEFPDEPWGFSELRAKSFTEKETVRASSESSLLPDSPFFIKS